MVTNHVFTVAGAKGGIGKTTTCLNLGTMLAEAGYSTVVVEMDLAMANVVDFLNLDLNLKTATTFHDVLAGHASVTEAMYETDVGLSVVPSGTTLDGYAETELDRLPDIVESLRWYHDIVLFDTPAGLSEETVRPLELADSVLLISTPRAAAVRNVRTTQELADRVETPVRGLILTRSGTGTSPGADHIAEFLDVELLGHVPEDDAVPHAQDQGIPVVQNAPNAGAAIAYTKIARKLVATEKAATEQSTAPSSSVDSGTTTREKEQQQDGMDGANATADEQDPLAQPADKEPTQQSPASETHPSNDSELLGPAPPPRLSKSDEGTATPRTAAHDVTTDTATESDHSTEDPEAAISTIEDASTSDGRDNDERDSEPENTAADRTDADTEDQSATTSSGSATGVTGEDNETTTDQTPDENLETRMRSLLGL
ncbi:P-loop NTPase [Haloarcula nitratireducens]|uniref:P-loop NTPase n=1 Tax=Haloarcula nitratireducens TaxID=2487749 RepID=A0AAW4PLU0_9EURY|nr:P-loop NTPase [Halomicroarcula nitratireducens]MBX0298250.1 P-loop NTPase [Halomicroarcula nitratireducens]